MQLTHLLSTLYSAKALRCSVSRHLVRVFIVEHAFFRALLPKLSVLVQIAEKMKQKETGLVFVKLFPI